MRHIKLVQCIPGLIGIQEVSPLLEILGKLGIVGQIGRHLLIADPLVADQFDRVISFGVLQVFVRRLDEAISKIVQFLKRRIGKRGIVRVLFQALGRLASENRVEIFTGGLQGGADIIDRGKGFLHILEHRLEFLDVSGDLGRQTHQGAELIGAGLHDDIGGQDAVLIVLVIQEEFLHVAGPVFSRLTGEAGSLGNIAAGLRGIHRPVDQLGKNNTKQAHGKDRGQDHNRFLVLHDTKD